MATKVKPTPPTSSDFSTWGFDLKFFVGLEFSWPLSSNEIKLDVPDDHISKVIGDKTVVRVATTAPITKANA
jgi:hypothetical protein